MRVSLNNFLSSGYQFSDNNNLQRFRYSLLNSLLLIAAFFTCLNYSASVLKLIIFTPLYENALLFYVFSCIIAILTLRIKKTYYSFSVNIIVLSSLLLFYIALFTILDDEFRLIWFFLVVFASFVLMGKKYGVFLVILLLTSILVINQRYDLGFSQLAQFTFFNSFLIFTAFSYFFLEKIEKDSVEFELLNNKLKAKVEDEVKQREEQEIMLLRQCRMANMGEMLDSIAHQWRQPLMHINSILMNVDIELENKSKDEQYLKDKTNEVASLTEHMSQTIDDFRDLFKLEKEQTQFILKNAIDDVLTLMKNGFNNVTIDYQHTDGDLILGHKSELTQVIIILLSNAVDVLNKRNIVNKKIYINTSISNNKCIISIEDNAGGIVPENICDIFNPYFTTKEQAGSTGLGLYIAKIIMQRKMHGKITAENSSGGAIFKLVFET